MKKLMSSMLAIAAMASMISCSTEDILDEGGQIDNGPVEIKLNAGVSATTKAAIDESFDKDFDVYFFMPTPATEANVNWNSGDKIKATVLGTPGHAIVFKDNDGNVIKKYYEDDATNKTYLAACHIDNSTPIEDNLSTTGDISFTITGEQDIMATDGQSANKTDQFKPFQFKHLLSQIQIDIKGDAAAKAAFGTIKKVEIKDVDTQLKLTLGNTPTIAPVELAPVAPITVYNDATGKDLTAAGQTAGTVMIYNGGNTPYGTSTNALTLKITSNKDGDVIESEVKVDNIKNTNNNFEGLDTGKKHVITLNFKERISATASVVAWGEGGTGNGSVL